MSKMFISRYKCPICGSQNLKEIFCESYSSHFLTQYLKDTRRGSDTSFISDEEYVICRCNVCHLIFQKNIPNKDLSAILYGKWIDEAKEFNLIRGSRQLKYYKYLSKTVEKMISHLNKPSLNIMVYDFGMGWGDFCVMCQAYGCSAVGTELSPEKINYAKSLGVKNIELDALPCEEFDIVNANQIFEHLDDPVSYLQKISKSLAKKGILRIAVPNGDKFDRELEISNVDFRKILLQDIKLVAPLGHINCFTTPAINKMFELADLHPISLRNESNISEYTIRDIKNLLFKGNSGSFVRFLSKS
jgi:SAM-dependent methyltransferase